MAKRFFLVVFIVAGFILVGNFLPRAFHRLATKNVPATDSVSTPVPGKTAYPASAAKVEKQWPEALVDSVLSRYGVPEKNGQKRRGAAVAIHLPLGKPLEQYALEIWQLCEGLGIAVEGGSISENGKPAFTFQLRKNQEHLRLRVDHADRWLAGAGRIAVVFLGLDSCTPDDLSRITATSWPKTLVIDAYGANTPLLAWAKAPGRDEVLLRLPMEPFEYPYQNPGRGALFLQNSEDEVGVLLREKSTLVPSARGFATHMGGRAVENRDLMGKLFRFLKSQDLVLLDLTASRRSITPTLARELEAHSRMAKAAEAGEDLPALVTAKVTAARRYGRTVLVLPWSPARLRQLNELFGAASFAEAGIELVTFSATWRP